MNPTPSNPRGRLSFLLLGAAVTLAACSASQLIASSPEAADIDRLVRQLGDDDFDCREAASVALDALDDPAAVEALLAAAADSPDPEVRQRAAILLARRVGRFEVRRLEGHSDAVRAIAFSPDGRRILTAGHDGTARVWDAATGEQLLRLDCGAGSAVFAAAYSPDGRLVLTGGAGGVLRLWDAGNGREVRRFGGGRDVWSLAISPDGRRVAAGCDCQVHPGEAARVYDVGDGKELFPFAEDALLVPAVAFTPDGRRIVSAVREQDDCGVVVRDAASGKEQRRFGKGPGLLWGLALSPDGRTALGGWEGGVRLWDAATGEELRRFPECRAGASCVAFSADGRRVAAAGAGADNAGRDGGFVRVWDVRSGRELRAMRAGSGREGLDPAVTCVALSPDGRLAVTGGLDGVLRLWRLPD